MEVQEIREKLKSLENLKIAEQSKRYLKSPYVFYGIKVPELRKIARKFKKVDIYEAYNLFNELWQSGNHEEMSLGIFILQSQKKKYNLETWDFLVKRLEKARTWDHIDYLSSSIFGEILLNDLSLNSEIKKMSESQNPWVRRTSIVSNLPLIKKNKLELAFLLAEKLIYDEDVYVQKAAGWMLREAGKRNRLAVRDFILRHLDMKAQAFSYATEKMKELRKIKRVKENDKKEGKRKKSLFKWLN